MTQTSQPGMVGVRIEGKTAEGKSFLGRVLALGDHDVAFELPASEPHPRRDEVIAQLAVLSGSVVRELGSASVSDVVDAGAVLYCRAQRAGGQSNGHAVLNGMVAVGVEEHCAAFVSTSLQSRHIDPSYRMAVVEIEDFLRGFEAFLTSLSPALLDPGPEEGSGDRRLDVIREQVTPILSALFEAFEAAASRVRPEEVASHSAYAMSRLHRYLLGSPFQWRIYRKPLGYAGDYEMVSMILRQCYEGNSPMAKILHRWLVGQILAEAHRNRVEILARRLHEASAGAAQNHGGFKAFSLGCGPAGEVELFLKRSGMANNSEFTLVDFNDETLAVAETRLRAAQRAHAPKAQIRFLKRSAAQFLRSAGREFAGGQDFVYCAGLFDYLADGVCVPLIRAFHQMLRVGGSLMVTNVQSPNPMHGVMTHLFDWHLECRDSARMRSLWDLAGLEGDPAVYVDDTTGNVFLEVMRDA